MLSVQSESRRKGTDKLCKQGTRGSSSAPEFSDDIEKDIIIHENEKDIINHDNEKDVMRGL